MLCIGYFDILNNRNTWGETKTGFLWLRQLTFAKENMSFEKQMSWLYVCAEFLKNSFFSQMKKGLRRHHSLYLQENFACGEMTKF